MTGLELATFFDYIKKTRQIFGPCEIGESTFGQGAVLVAPIDDFDELALDDRLPFFSFKRFFVPEKELLFDYQSERLKENFSGQPIALFGVNLLDLKSVVLYDQVFEKDPYYQARRKNILIIGHSLIPKTAQNIFEQTFEEDILEHLSFDIFLGEQSNGGKKNWAVFTGSLLGRKILDSFGYDEYINIQFSGPVKEGELDPRMLRLKDRLENAHNQKIWEALGKRCIECGKCTIACPTCFCFGISDQPMLEAGKGQRQRCWDSCYYQEFSEVALGHKFLNSTAARIHFWYYHKFARIPAEFDFMGCVGCRRCQAVCPVGIDITEVLKQIEKS